MARSEVNPNVSWVHQRGIFLFYLVAIFVFYGLTCLAFDGLGYTEMAYPAWTVTHITHSLVTSITWHFIQGTANDETDRAGEFEGLTFWEQVEGGTPWTNTKKLLIVVPAVLLYLAITECGHEAVLSLANIVAFGFEIIPKMPSMHQVRLLGLGKLKD